MTSATCAPLTGSVLVEYDARSDNYLPTEELQATNDPRWQALKDIRTKLEQ